LQRNVVTLASNPQPGGPGPPSDRLANVCPQPQGSLFVAFYDAKGYRGGILTGLHTRSTYPSVYSVCTT
jgi:hypothetical protein